MKKKLICILIIIVLSLFIINTSYGVVTTNNESYKTQSKSLFSSDTIKYFMNGLPYVILFNIIFVIVTTFVLKKELEDNTIKKQLLILLKRFFIVLLVYFVFNVLWVYINNNIHYLYSINQYKNARLSYKRLSDFTFWSIIIFEIVESIFLNNRFKTLLIDENKKITLKIIANKVIAFLILFIIFLLTF